MQIRTVVKNTKSLEEFKAKQKKLEELASKAYALQKAETEGNGLQFELGEPVLVLATKDDLSEIILEYANGKGFLFSGFDRPLLTYREIK